ncbi:cation:proton antiporter [Synechococcus sp. CS-1330]|nr:cation:proton antiporter [Synechococcus sp. CS-1330]
MSTGLQGLLTIVAIVAVSPFVARLFGGRLPTVALLMLGGIAVGPSGLAWLQQDPAIDLFSKIGLGLIFALIGLNIDQKTLGGTPGKLGALGWLATIMVGVLLVSILPLGGGLRPVALVVALSSTALSTLLVILRESGEWDSPLGRLLLSAGTWGQLGPVLAVALLMGSTDPITTVLSVALVVVVAWLLALVPVRMGQTSCWYWLESVAGSASASPMQLLYLLVVGLIALSVVLGVDILMGAVLAGLVMRRFIAHPDISPAFKQLEASAYGLFVPLFFVVAGSRLDLASVAAHPWGPLICLIGILLMRGLPQWLLYRQALPDPIERLRFSLLVSQSLNLPIVVAYLEVQAGLMSPQVGAALVGGSLLSVLLLPALAMAMKR